MKLETNTQGDILIRLTSSEADDLGRVLCVGMNASRFAMMTELEAEDHPDTKKVTEFFDRFTDALARAVMSSDLGLGAAQYEYLQLPSLQDDGPDVALQSIDVIMADGEDHIAEDYDVVRFDSAKKLIDHINHSQKKEDKE